MTASHLPSSSDGRIVLALNSGSSSLKFGVYRVARSQTTLLMSGMSETGGASGVAFHARDARTHAEIRETISQDEPGDVLTRIVALLDEWKLPAVSCVGHRIVHGGPALRAHCLIDEAVLAQLQAAAAFAPIHMPPALALVGLARERFPDCPHAACLDTAYHATMSAVARTLPLPDALRSAGIERYGFHGLSCESIVRQLAPCVPRRLVIAHLGNGSSITAVLDGRSVDTSMGLTPTGGVVMGTRSGDLDPGLLVYLMRERNVDADRMEDLVNHHSGLLALSGTSSDMRRLHTLAGNDPRAAAAIDAYSYSVAKQIAAMITALDGIDTLVFTAGIGENDALTRQAICDRLTWAGLTIDEKRNAAHQDRISTDSSPISVRVVPTQEDEQIAIHSDALVRSC